MKINHKRTLKLVTLLVTSLFIATVSADVYNQLFMSGTITASTFELRWDEGVDNATVGLTINGVTCSMSSLTAPVGGARNYTDPVRLNNTDSVQHTFDLVIESITGSTADLDYIYVRLFNSTGTYQDTLTVWASSAQGSDLSSLIIAANDWWRVEWDIRWGTSSTTSSTVDVSLRMDVTA